MYKKVEIKHFKYKISYCWDYMLQNPSSNFKGENLNHFLHTGFDVICF
jgi:hypothetical protein